MTAQCCITSALCLWHRQRPSAADGSNNGLISSFPTTWSGASGHRSGWSYTQALTMSKILWIKSVIAQALVNPKRPVFQRWSNQEHYSHLQLQLWLYEMHLRSIKNMTLKSTTGSNVTSRPPDSTKPIGIKYNPECCANLWRNIDKSSSSSSLASFLSPFWCGVGSCS